MRIVMQEFTVAVVAAVVAQLVEALATEREACEELCRKEAGRALWNWEHDISANQPYWNGVEQMASHLADAIRARHVETK